MAPRNSRLATRRAFLAKSDFAGAGGFATSISAEAFGEAAGLSSGGRSSRSRR
jgi:hypothetical protein